MKLFLLLQILISSFININNNFHFLLSTKAYSKDPISLTQTNENAVKDYYGDFSNKRGDDLKTYLYDVISKNNNFITYDSVTQWYKITDRNYSISNKIENLNEYDFKNENGLTYYTYNMYVSNESNNDKNKAYSNAVNALKVDTSTSKVNYVVDNDKVTGTRPNSYVQVDKEHVWPKNHGFKLLDDNKKDIFNKGAPTDLHNLIAADHNTNSAGHNDNYYGEVVNKEGNEIYAYLADGSKEISGWLGIDKDGDKVFEPTDEWKGNIARCLFYMATRYSKNTNNSQAEPYLVLTDDKDVVEGKDSFNGVHYNLSTLLSWHKLDPVDDYEKYRNDLIYINVQKNRNPYIDYPNLVDRVFSKEYDFALLKEEYQLHLSEKTKLDIVLPDEASNYSLDTINYDSNIIEIKNENEVLPKSVGETDLIYVLKKKDNDVNKLEFKTKIIIKDNVKFKEIGNIELKSFQQITLDLEISNLFDDEKIEYYSTEGNISISNNVIKAGLMGEDRIEVYLVKDNSKTLLTSVDVLVRLNILMIIILSVVIVIIITIVVIILIISFRKKKKGNNKPKTRKKKSK